MINKKCQVCKGKVDLLFSLNKMWCFECKKFYDFKLKKNKKSILIKGLIGR